MYRQLAGSQRAAVRVLAGGPLISIRSGSALTGHTALRLMEHYFRHLTVIDSIESFFGQRKFLPTFEKYTDEDDVVSTVYKCFYDEWLAL